MQNIYILGETTYDIIFKNNKPVDAKVGGSQLNTAISLGRMQLPVSFISQFGKDSVGEICCAFIAQNGIDLSYIIRNEGSSRVALAFLDETNDANYTFFKAENSSPYTFPEVKENDLVLFGSSFATRTDIRNALVNFLTNAKNKNAILIYDPNFRKGNSTNEKERLEIVKENIRLSTITKGSDDDFENLFGTKNSADAWEEIRKLDVSCLFYTANKNGVKVHWGKSSLFVTVPVIEPLSTIGAGDNFNAGLIFSLYRKKTEKQKLSHLTSKDWREMAQVAIRFAQKVCLSYDNYISEEFAKELKNT